MTFDYSFYSTISIINIDFNLFEYFRDADRQVLLHHVKDHYIQQRIDKLTSENKKLQVGVTTIVPVQSGDKLESDQQPEASDKDDDDSNIDENDNDEASV